MDLHLLVLIAPSTHRLLGETEGGDGKIAMKVEDIGIRTQRAQGHMKSLVDIPEPSLPGAVSYVSYWVGEESGMHCKVQSQPRKGGGVLGHLLACLSHHAPRF